MEYVFINPVSIKGIADEDSFHLAIGPGENSCMTQFFVLFNLGFVIVLFTAQIFGLIPVSGILRYNVRSVKFKWISFRMLLCVGLLVGATMETIISYCQVFYVGISIGNSGIFSFQHFNIKSEKMIDGGIGKITMSCFFCKNKIDIPEISVVLH